MIQGVKYSQVLMRGAFVIFALYISFLSVPHVYAQSAIGSAGLTLIPTPQFPKPNSTVQVSIDDYSLETTGATITWYVNGVERKESKNERMLPISVGAVGKKTTVRVALSRPNVPTLESSLTLTPATVDIILETNTYVPYFYKGKALPSGESQIRATAVLNDGSTVPDTAYTYKWTVGTEVFSGGPLKGRNTITFDLPHYDNGGLTVEVTNGNGEVIGGKSVPLTSIAPELHFYEYSPLRGLFQKELPNVLPLIGEETTIYAEPYFLNASLNRVSADFTWKINGEETQTGEEMPNAITLRRVGGGGDADISFTAVTKKKIPQFVESTFGLMFQ